MSDFSHDDDDFSEGAGTGVLNVQSVDLSECKELQQPGKEIIIQSQFFPIKPIYDRMRGSSSDY